ncbi:MAG: aspartate aminotransferase family protein [Alicyclobacillaceae bacterium]|nr:aspartate aminotransferase family protein [Alicyclobacillaceae bacterium]
MLRSEGKIGVAELYESYINPGLAKLYRLMGVSSGEARGEGCFLYDEEGRRYIDCVSGYGSLPFGHRPLAVLRAVRDQLERMALSSKVMPGRPAAELAEALAARLPGDLQYSFFCNSGAEAVEGALKLARAATGRTEFVAARGGFHGKTLGALSVSGRERYRAPFYPLLPGVTHVPYGDVKALEKAVTNRTAAVILEPVQGEGGVRVPPEGYLRAVRGICDRTGTLLILDEVQTGLGRTGRWFAMEKENVVPDIVCLAKALGGGVMPIGCFVARPDAARAFWGDPLVHTSTFGGNALAAAAGLATLRFLEEAEIPERVAETGAWLKRQLVRLSAEYPAWIREVRGEGFLLGVEFADEARGGLVMSALVEQGVLTAFALNSHRVVRIEPPLIADRLVLSGVVERWAGVLARLEALVGDADWGAYGDREGSAGEAGRPQEGGEAGADGPGEGSLREALA